MRLMCGILAYPTLGTRLSIIESLGPRVSMYLRLFLLLIDEKSLVTKLASSQKLNFTSKQVYRKVANSLGVMTLALNHQIYKASNGMQIEVKSNYQCHALQLKVY